MSRPRILVLGGKGFIGRHAVQALRVAGADVVVGSRFPQAGEAGIRMERMRQAGDWHDVLRGFDAVVNCVGILRPRWRERYEDVHHRAPAALASACAARGMRLVHVSALGLRNPVRSGFLHSKRHGEDAIRACGGDWHIVRPSLLDGEGGFGARWLRRVSRWPLHPLPRGAKGRIAALDVRDLGIAIARLALHGDDTHREHDLGGHDVLPLGEYLALLRARAGLAPALRIPLPDALVRLVAHVCDLLHLTPLSFGHWELLQHDNCPAENRLPALLGRAPLRVGEAAPACDAPWLGSPVLH